MAVKKQKEIIMNPALEQALKGFVPEFGNPEDLGIVSSVSRIRKKLATVDAVVFREAEKKKNNPALTAKMREIQRDEQWLITRIIKRNLDF